MSTCRNLHLYMSWFRPPPSSINTDALTSQQPPSHMLTDQRSSSHINGLISLPLHINGLAYPLHISTSQPCHTYTLMGWYPHPCLSTGQQPHPCMSMGQHPALLCQQLGTPPLHFNKLAPPPLVCHWIWLHYWHYISIAEPVSKKR